MTADAPDYVLPAGVDPSALVSTLAEHVSLVADTAVRTDRVYMDTFDGRLHAAGKLVERGDLEVGGSAARPVLVADLAPGAMREALLSIVEDRAMLPITRVRARIRPLRMLNGDAKTVVRLELEQPEVVRRGQSPLTLRPRLRIRAVRGYERAGARLHRVVVEELKLPVATMNVADEAALALGLDPAGTSAKVEVPLRDEERADVASVALLARLAEVMDDNLPGTLDDVDPEFLHDYRVALRRTRSLMRELRGVFPPDARQRFRDELRWLQLATGPVRDLDVHLADMAGYRASLPDASSADLAPLAALLEQRRLGELRRMRRTLRSTRRQQLRDDWLAFLGSVSTLPDGEDRPNAGEPIGKLARSRVERVYTQMLEMGTVIGNDSPDEDLHELRKRGKELRYLLELFGALLPPASSKSLVTALKSLQDTLGRFQDRAVQADALRALGDDLVRTENGPAALMAMGLVVDRLNGEQSAARREFAERFAAFASKATRSRVAEVVR